MKFKPGREVLLMQTEISTSFSVIWRRLLLSNFQVALMFVTAVSKNKTPYCRFKLFSVHIYDSTVHVDHLYSVWSRAVMH